MLTVSTRLFREKRAFSLVLTASLKANRRVQGGFRRTRLSIVAVRTPLPLRAV